MTTITEEEREEIKKAFLSDRLYLIAGVGDADIPGHGEACTFSEINLVLTGELTDAPHPCICPVIREWVINTQDEMPARMRNSQEWREAAIGIAGTRASSEVEIKRTALLREWSKAALLEDWFLLSLPNDLCRQLVRDEHYDEARGEIIRADRTYRYLHATVALNRMSSERYTEVTLGIYRRSALSFYKNSDNAELFWERRNPAKMLQDLINCE